MKKQYLKNLKLVKENGLLLKDITEQTEEICLAAIKQNPFALKYVQNPTEEMCLEALKQDGFALRFIKEPIKEMYLEAIKQNGFAIQLITNPTEEMYLLAVKQNGLSLEFVKNQTEKICLIAVCRDRRAIEFVNDKFLNDIYEILNIKHLKGDMPKHRELIVQYEYNEPRFYIGCQRNISLETLLDRIHNEKGGLLENPHRQIYLDFLKEQKLI